MEVLKPANRRSTAHWLFMFWLGFAIALPALAASATRLEDCSSLSNLAIHKASTLPQPVDKGGLATLSDLVETHFGAILQTLEGGQAWVFHVQTPSGEEIKIKTMKNPLKTGVLEHEARAMEKSLPPTVKGPKPVAIHNKEGKVFLESRWVQTTLEKGIPQYFGRNAPPERVFESMENFLDTLSVFHEQGLVHRDLKPENILMEITPNADGSVDINLSLNDFGIASINGILAKGVGLRSGTPLYMSPRQAQGGPPSVHDDLSATRKIFAEMALGLEMGDIPPQFMSTHRLPGVIIKELTSPIQMIALHHNLALDPAVSIAIDYPARDAQEWRSIIGETFRAYLENGSDAVVELATNKWLPELAKESPDRAYQLIASSKTLSEAFHSRKITRLDAGQYAAIEQASNNHFGRTLRTTTDFFHNSRATRTADGEPPSDFPATP